MELEQDCSKCKGKGWKLVTIDGKKRRSICFFCVSGQVPSEEGRKLLEFILKYTSVSCYIDGDLDEGRSVGSLFIVPV